jgi:hypothetical protein
LISSSAGPALIVEQVSINAVIAKNTLHEKYRFILISYRYRAPRLKARDWGISRAVQELFFSTEPKLSPSLY